MPRIARRLNDLAVRRAKADPTKNTIMLDGDGLRLVVTPSGGKFFEFKSAAGGTERTVRLGRYPDLGLEAARHEAARLRGMAKDGLNPVAERQLERIRNRIKSGTTFEAVSEELLTAKAKNVSPSYLKRATSAIKANLYPMLGSLPIQSIDAPVLREALLRIERRGSLDMLTDVRRLASEIFSYAKAQGQYQGDNPADALLKNVFKKHEGENMRALPWSEVGTFWKALDTVSATAETIICIKLIVLTASRPGEVRGARWSEFDMENARWNIPGERMKMKRGHSVPLSKQALVLLEQLKPLTGHSEYCFPSRVGSKSPIVSDMGVLKTIKKIAGDIHAHGFRSMFSTHAAESGKWPDSVKEAALAHSKRGIEGIYDRATHYPERVKMLQWYADQIDTAVNGAEVIPMVGKAA
jgi:integrase